jgi:lipopolysaccharide transport system ATP-binding protein
MSSVVVSAEHIGKKYTIGHRAENERYQSLRDTMARSARGLWTRAANLAQGKPVIFGDHLEEVHALHDISFDIREGEAVGLVGRNGAGKSTLLKILSRITEPSSGQITIHGRVASLLEVGTGFHPELTGRENIYLNGGILGMSRAEVRQRFDSIVSFAGVERFIDTPVKRYSSGMYVRLAFSVAAHLDTEILVIDEVLAVGDTEFQKRCLGKMDEVANSGRTLLFVSHSMPMISSLCSRCLLLHNGQLLADGPTSEVVHRYQSGAKLNSAYVQYPDSSRQPGDDSVRLLAGWVENEPHEPRFEYTLFEPLRLCMKFRVLEDLPKAPHPNFHVFDSAGNCVFVTSPHDWPRDMHLARGDYSAACEIPAHFLNDGMYSVGLALNCLHNGLHTSFFEQHALSFNIVDPIDQNPHREVSGWAGQIPGVVRPLLSWKLETAA